MPTGLCDAQVWAEAVRVVEGEADITAVAVVHLWGVGLLISPCKDALHPAIMCSEPTHIAEDGISASKLHCMLSLLQAGYSTAQTNA